MNLAHQFILNNKLLGARLCAFASLSTGGCHRAAEQPAEIFVAHPLGRQLGISDPNWANDNMVQHPVIDERN
jgi:hypothetical protein